MVLYQLEHRMPSLAADAYVAESASVIGLVELGARVSVWFHATLRGDNEPIRVGADSNIQEAAVLHTDLGAPLAVGERVTVGHQAVLHGCTIGDGSLIGIQAVILNHAVIGRDCLVGAGALVTEGKRFDDRSLIIGSPAKAVRLLNDEEVARMHRNALHYAQRGQLYKTQLKRIG